MIVKIKEALYNQEDKLKSILEDIGCQNIHNISDIEIRFGMDDEGTGSGNKLRIDTLSYRSFSRDGFGDILTLVADVKGIELGESIKWLANKLNIKKGYTDTTNIKLPFDGFFKGFGKAKEVDETPPPVYSEIILEEYLRYGVSNLFIQDGISAITQEAFTIGYDIVSNRITIVWRNEIGEIIGIMGRKNRIEIKKKELKYLPVIDFRKSCTLFGLYENYKYILEKSIIIIVESEKSVLKGRELGFYNVVALGGNNISPRQAKLIKSMGCNVIVALDEGMPLSHATEQAYKVQVNNVFFSNEVNVVDMCMSSNPYITQEKVSMLDLDRITIDKIMVEHLIYIDPL
ncbi:hypothetical protein [Clostridium tagluense]|uniref:DNA primase n=1 Tax=Clostridium tagluense TaxID=360422 RepID=A0A401UQC3_9CLOT|nr:hypothetical protein [Clostridium tagluense]GCD11711.1 DNA primase [Clostridium tagluense]